MGYHEKLQRLFKENQISQSKMADELEISRGMVSKYFNDLEPHYRFLQAIIKLIPNADLNMLLKEDYNLAEEEAEIYSKPPEVLIKEIQIRVSQLEDWHKNDTIKN